MRLDDFLQAAREFSACAKRVALALQHSPSRVKGRRSEEIVAALSLDLVGFTEGSPAAVAQLERSSGQMTLPMSDLGEAVYRTLLEGMESVGAAGGTLPPGFDAGVLIKLRDFGRLLGKGVTRVGFTLSHRTRPVQASYTARTLERIRQRLAQPGPQQQRVEGRLLMADFKETDRRVRVHPAVGAPWLCRFPESLSTEVEESIRQFVRVTGTMSYQPGGEPGCLDVTDIEQIEVPEAAMALGESASGNWSYDFWESPSAEEYARRQGTPMPTDPTALYGNGDAADWDGFDEAVERWRGGSLAN
jgi:hypothetical protein